MVAVIHASSSLSRALNYNEQKVNRDIAKCMAAVNYPKEIENLSFKQKLKRLTNQAALNVRTKINSVHISLNFDVNEKLEPQKLLNIAKTYMDKIGFGQQPYLIYQHLDSGHPHLHIVTTNIKADGKRIELHNLGRNQSEKARKEIEISFDLVRADSKNKVRQFELKPVTLEKVEYGKSDIRRAITRVLNEVLDTYKFTSIPELNAVLKQYNVIADRGSEDSRTYQKNGLLYRVLDAEGKKVGVPVKASLIYNSPTLKYLQDKFLVNEPARLPHKQRIKNIIDKAVNKKLSLPQIISELKKEMIHVELRKSQDGFIYGVTYLDHQTKCVFNGSDLGKSYTAKGLQEHAAEKVGSFQQENKQNEFNQNQVVPTGSSSGTELSKVLDILIEPSFNNNYVPFHLKKSRKKKKKRFSI